jgi:hypothetical protein
VPDRWGHGYFIGILGHATLAMRHSHLSPRHLRDEMEKTDAAAAIPAEMTNPRAQARAQKPIDGVVLLDKELKFMVPPAGLVSGLEDPVGRSVRGSSGCSRRVARTRATKLAVSAPGEEHPSAERSLARHSSWQGNVGVSKVARLLLDSRPACEEDSA